MSNPATSRPADTYSPLYFLTSVGAGGLAVTFFMYLMFWVKHPGQPVPVFEDIARAWAGGSLPLQVGIAVALIGIAVFAFLNLKYLVWNLSRFAAWRKTPAYAKLRASNAESQLLAMPLAIAMSINGLFIVGLVFVPGLWGVVEYLFPLAMVAFALNGLFALRLIGHFLGRVLSDGGIFDVTAHNSFAQLLPSFALAMTAVGLAAPAAMSTSPTVVAASLILSTILGSMALIYAIVAAVTAFNSMLHYGTAKESGPTLMIIVPLMTILGIMWMRQNHGLHTTFDEHTTDAGNLMLMTKLLAVQLTFGLLGLLVLARQGYAKTFLTGDKNSPGSYALVCPGVAMSVMLKFWINKGLVANGVIEKFGAAYWGFTAVAIAFQLAMVALVWHLNRRHYGGHVPTNVVPAE
ncbi:TsoY family (seleno)protein [Marivivens marinus]|uniref:TsoY family (seleno)protein n=1 Tax=Marivivens marinus TaxID=3110173 RepID=UPI003B848B84